MKMTAHDIERNWRLATGSHAAGDTTAATKACKAILSVKPEEPRANGLLSVMHMSSGHPRLASKYAIAASAHALGLPIEDLLGVSWALMACGELRHARNLLLSIDPRDPDRMRGLWGTARQLGLLELHEPALRCLDGVTDPSMRNASVVHLRGNLLEIMGKSAEAATAYEESIALRPQFALAHLTLAQMGPPAGREQRIDRLRALLRGPSIAPDDLATLNYALFMELDRLDDTGAAWAALAAGAGVRARILGHDPALETRLFDKMIHATDANFLGPVATTNPRDDQVGSPIFIVGMPRTGTTLLERILGNHPDVQVCGELTSLQQQHQWVANRTWAGNFDLTAADEQSRLDAALLGSRYREAVAWRLTGKRYFTDKTPGNFMAIALILKAMPDARIIHIHRDPLDACFSNLKVLFAPDAFPYSYTFHGLATHQRNYARLMRHWNNIFPGRVLNIAYEDLVSDADQQARRALEYCDLGSEADITDINKNRNNVSTFSRSQVREPIHQRNVGGWRRYGQYLKPLENMLHANG